jgi:hypothetical protein
VDIAIPFRIEPQPDETTCGPTCLHAVYRYYNEHLELPEVIEATEQLDAGGTLAVFLAVDALRRGYMSTIYTYNLQMFDPSWFTQPDTDIAERLRQQAESRKNPKLRHATEGYLEFLRLGGKLRFADLTTRLIRGILRRNLPILTGLSSTYLYRARRTFGPNDVPDDIRGAPDGHFVVLCGYHRQDRTVLIADPYLPNPVARGELFYSINIDRVICAILLGVLTYDANLLVIQPRR